ncbi:hypothetical protein FISHEDRAFT_65448 [Fistulina hepatica ATCC 64428]|nr:hypothetical protein FISHEDRAFT_65448 [Fistulina hepatica ATCC 64428]
MPRSVLTVPVVLASGGLHFTEVPYDGTAQDVIDTLIRNPDVVHDALGDEQEAGWALQRIRAQLPGRLYDEAELNALDEALITPSAAIAPIVNVLPETSLWRQLTSFPNTTHFQNPVLRLVSLNARLCISLTFLRVPEIYDGFQYKVFLAPSMTTADLIELVIIELGLARALPIPGGGTLEYVLEVSYNNNENRSRLPPTAALLSVDNGAARQYVLCIPDEWYRRPKSHRTSSGSRSSSTAASHDLENLSESGAEEDEGTAKAAKIHDNSPTQQRRYTHSQNRLSGFFDDWLNSGSTPSDMPAEKRKSIVSEPVLVTLHTTGSMEFSDSDDAAVNVEEFEAMLNDMGLKGDKRTTMYQMAPERKRYLLEQDKRLRASQFNSVKADTPSFVSYGPARASGILPRLVPQLTGDSFIRRFSSWSSATKTPLPAPKDAVRDEETPIQPQSTGGLWSSWWSSSGGGEPKSGSARGNLMEFSSSTDDAQDEPRWYVEVLRSGQVTDMKLVKHLIDLRVQLSTAKLLWIEQFVKYEKGFDVLGSLLASLVAKGGERRSLDDIETSNLLETMKCLRILLNTQPGFDYVLASPTLITHIAYSLHFSSGKSRILASQLLAAICVLSPSQGHKGVINAMSDFRVAFGEDFRFKSLVTSLRVDNERAEMGAGVDAGPNGSDLSDNRWEELTATMVLIHSITNVPDSLLERIELRKELTRRGLDEAVLGLRHLKPPDSLLTQLDVYSEEKSADEEEHREMSSALPENHDPITQAVVQLAKQHDLYSTVVDILQHAASMMDRNMAEQTKATLMAVLEKFALNLLALDSLDEWNSCLHRFYASVEGLVGRNSSDAALIAPMRVVEYEELEALRSRVEELSTERVQLRNDVDQKAAEINVLKSLPPNGFVNQLKPAGKSGENVHGLVQRLVQKERQVLQLQTELERFKDQSSAESREEGERARRERDRVKWNTLTDEIARLKSKNTEHEASLGIKDKEILYLKRALESVYTRFTSREENREQRPSLDAEAIASDAIRRLQQKDDQIVGLTSEAEELKSEIQQLKSQMGDLSTKLASRPMTEQEFKVRSPPPPPPVPKKREMSSVVVSDASGLPVSPRSPRMQPRTSLPSSLLSTLLPTSQTPSADPSSMSSMGPESLLSPPPPPPPPPPLAPQPPPSPPPPPTVSFSVASSAALPPSSFPSLSISSHTSSIGLPPPPPPPPPSSSNSLPPPPPPPPPSNGGFVPPPPPGPPPPPSAFKMGPRGKNLQGPSKKLKPFFWSKLSSPAILRQSIWSEADAAWGNDANNAITLDLSDLEAIFSIDNVAKKSTAGLTGPMRRHSVMTMLDITRANNVAIMLSRIKLDLPDIRQALLELSDGSFSIDDLRAISRQLPTSDEVTRIQDFPDISKLAKADQYFGQIMTIPRLTQRMECMIYRRKSELDLEEIRPDLKILRDASQELRSSARLKQVLSVVLAVGNALNGSTFRGGARGFKLEALLKMKETRTVKGGTECPTLLHYIAKVLLRTDPSLVNFIEELPSLEAAARMSVQSLSQSVQQLVDGLAQVRNEITQVRSLKTVDPRDRFLIVMQPFVLQIEPKITALKNMAESVDKQLKSMATYFGETLDSPDGPKAEELFSIFTTFSSSLQKCALEVHDAQEKAAASTAGTSVGDAVSSEANARHPKEAVSVLVGDLGDPYLSSKMLSPPGSQGYTSRRTVGRGDVDQAIRSMRDGKRRHRKERTHVAQMFYTGNK